MYCGFRISSLHSTLFSCFSPPWNRVCRPPALHTALTSHFFIFCSSACSAHCLDRSSRCITGGLQAHLKPFHTQLHQQWYPPLRRLCYSLWNLKAQDWCRRILWEIGIVEPLRELSQDWHKMKSWDRDYQPSYCNDEEECYLECECPFQRLTK